VIIATGKVAAAALALNAGRVRTIDP